MLYEVITDAGLTHTIAECVGRFLQRQGLLERDGEISYLAGEAADRGAIAARQGERSEGA